MNKRGEKDRAIWMFAGGPMQELAATKILERGYKLIITDRDDNCICSKYAAEVVHLDTFDVPGNVEAAGQLKKKWRIEAVICPAADCHETVAGVGKLLGLHAISPAVSKRCRYKHVTRQALTTAGIPQPRFKAVTSLRDAIRFLQEIGGEGVVKATDNSGSRGFGVIRKGETINPETFQRAREAGTTGLVIVEELLRPLEKEIAEQSVETLWYDGTMYWLNWVDRLFRKDCLLFNSLKTGMYDGVSWGIEIGHINPAIHDLATKMDVFELIRRAGAAIGMKRERGGHVLKADIMLTENGPYIIELTPRLSGGWDSSASTPARGADFAGGLIALALGEVLDLGMWHRYFEFANPALFASVMAKIGEGAQDCIGRRFAIGADFERERSIERALNNLTEERYVVSMEQRRETADAQS
jgi:biotin carboxylase